jgi:hypothetical protein
VPSLVLLPSPLTRGVAWGRLPEALARTDDAGVHLIEPDDEDRPPYAARWVAACALQIGALPPGPVVLVAHSGAGPLLAALGGALRAAHRQVAAYAFVDAGLPIAFEGSRLDDYQAGDPDEAAKLITLLEAGGRFPRWSSDDLVPDVPDPDDRAALIAGLRPRDLAYWSEVLPTPTDWPNAPCVYLRTSSGYDSAHRQSQLRGWRTDSLDLGHFPGFSDPSATAAALLALLDGLIAREG